MLFVASLLLTVIVFALCGAPRARSCPRVGMNLALVLPGRRRCVHLHHWLLGVALGALVLGVVRASDGRLTPTIQAVLGACVGAALAGLTMYDDALTLVRPCAEAQPCGGEEAEEGQPTTE